MRYFGLQKYRSVKVTTVSVLKHISLHVVAIANGIVKNHIYIYRVAPKNWHILYP